MKYHRHKHSHELKQNILIFILIIANIATIGAGIIKNKKEQQRTNEVAKIEKAKDEEKKQKQIIEESNYDLYDKIENKKNISILVIGDSIGASNGADPGKEWFTKLNNWFSTKYQVHGSVKSITHPGGGINDGIKEYEADKGTGYDLVFFCYGQNDRKMNINEWSKKYEELLREVIEKNPKADVIPIIESSFLNGDTDRVSIPNTIVNISKYYELQYIDMRESFTNSGKEYNQLSGDGTHPNNDGYELYFKSTFELLSQNIHDNKKVDYTSKQNLF